MRIFKLLLRNSLPTSPIPQTCPLSKRFLCSSGELIYESLSSCYNRFENTKAKNSLFPLIVDTKIKTPLLRGDPLHYTCSRLEKPTRLPAYEVEGYISNGELKSISQISLGNVPTKASSFYSKNSLISDQYYVKINPRKVDEIYNFFFDIYVLPSSNVDIRQLKFVLMESVKDFDEFNIVMGLMTDMVELSKNIKLSNLDFPFSVLNTTKHSICSLNSGFVKEVYLTVQPGKVEKDKVCFAGVLSDKDGKIIACSSQEAEKTAVRNLNKHKVLQLY